MTDAELTKWLKTEGEWVDEDEPIAEVEAAKVTSELVTPAAGILTKILVSEGSVVDVGALLALIAASDDESARGLHDDDVSPNSGAKAGVDEPFPEGSPGSTDPIDVGPASLSSDSTVQRTRRQVAPRARRLAKTRGVDVEAIAGSGTDSRVTVPDVEAALVRVPSEPVLSTGDESMASTATPMTADDDETYLVTGVRRTIARRMHASLQSTAQLTLVATADVTRLVSYREGLTGQHRPTFTHFVVRAAALALGQHPMLNASMVGDRLRVHSNIHIGVAADTDSGLIVPVIRDADRKSVLEIAAEMRRLVAMVRSGVFGSEDVTGGTFTVSSLGGFGIDAFTPILNPPEAAILGVGRIAEHATRDTERILAWRQFVTLSLTIDHRIVDGAPAAAFLGAVVAGLEDVDLLS